jgi:hypothetical protein
LRWTAIVPDSKRRRRREGISGSKCGWAGEWSKTAAKRGCGSIGGAVPRYTGHAVLPICKLRSGSEPLTAKIVNDWPEAAGGQFKDRQSDGQPNAPRPGAPGIKIEHSVNGLDSRPMRVAGNDYVNSAQYWVQTQFLNYHAARGWCVRRVSPSRCPDIPPLTRRCRHSL